MPDKHLASRINKITKKLRAAYPDAGCELNFKTPFELLVAAILSAQCTDKRVNQLTPGLFKKYNTIEKFAKASLPELEKDVKPTGFYKNKAKSLKGAAGDLIEKHGGKVPESMEELTALKGVGRKTANLLRGVAFGKPALIVDTHFIRLTGRLKLSEETAPEKIEAGLATVIPPKDQTLFSHLLTIHGRRCCFARRPNCPECPIEKLCPFPDKTK
ncbi:MAG: endonuclease III [Candidatus Omnitrophica bacterium]|nr:endonuclease III [Candidatus Omnitrophota bacterium]